MKQSFVTYASFLIAFILISATGLCQRRLVSGFLRDSTTLFPIANGTITNSTTAKIVKTDATGFFKIEVGANDFIYASAKSYRYDTLVYSLMFTDTLAIYLAFAGNVLPAVTVRGQYSRYQLDSMERRKEFDESRGTVLKTLSNDHPSGFGLTFNLDKVFKKKFRDQKSQENVFTALEKMNYVNYRYSPNLVAYYTGYKGEKLRDFMNVYTPSFEWLRQHPSNEDVLYYINDNLKRFKSNSSK